MQRSLSLFPVLPCLAALVAVRGHAGQPAVGSWTRPQLVTLVLAGFCALTLATIFASQAIVAYGLGGQSAAGPSRPCW